MKLLICIWHPAHVHFFKNLIWKMEKEGHQIEIAAYKKDFNIDLLEKYGLKYHNLGNHKDSNLIFKVLNMFSIDKKLYRIMKNYNPDFVLTIGGAYPSFISKLLGKKCFAFTDSESAKLSIMLTVPFVYRILTPLQFKKDLGHKQLRYNSFHELAYLHPNYFTPNKPSGILFGDNESKEYAIIRFVSWGAAHDIGQTGLSLEMKRKIVHSLSKKCRVIISSESKLPKDLEMHRMDFPPDKVHDILQNASLYLGEGATMAVESIILGTPAIYVNTLDNFGHFEELKRKYKLLYVLKGKTEILKKSIEILNGEHLPEWKLKREKMLDEKIDLTYFIESLLKKDAGFVG